MIMTYDDMLLKAVHALKLDCFFRGNNLSINHNYKHTFV